MKTSILVPGYAALCLLITFAEAPRRPDGDKMKVALTNNMAISTSDKVTMLPGVFITADRKKEVPVTVPPLPAADFSNLKFHVNEFMDADLVYYVENEISPNELGYLKFNVRDIITGSELNEDEVSELPVVDEENSAIVSSPEPTILQFEYLRFDMTDYITNKMTGAEGMGELPVAESETTDQCGYLKFDVTKYLSAYGLGTEVEFELPED